MRGKKDKIQLEEYQSFGGTFNASLSFIRSNFGEIFRGFVLYAGPVIVLFTSVSIWFEERNALLSERLGEYAGGIAYDLGELFTEHFGISRLTGGLELLSQLLLCSLCAVFVVNYHNNADNHFSLKEATAVVKNKALSLLGLFAILFIFNIAIALFYDMIMFGSASLGTGTYIFGRVVVVVAILLVYPPLVFVFNGGYIALIKENLTPWAAFKRAFAVLKGSYWWTWVVLWVAIICFWALGWIFSSPEYMIQWFIIDMDLFGFGSFSGYETLLKVVHFIGVFLGQLFDGFLYVLIAIHYFSLVEKKEATGLMKRINSIGERQEYFRGEEDY